MAKTPPRVLTDAEAHLMAVLWELSTGTVAEVTAAIQKKRAWTYSTVQTILRILETKGFVTHEKMGRAFIYRPLVNAGQARRHALRALVSRLFDNSPSLVVLNILDDEKLDPKELKRLKKLIEDA